MDVIFFRKFSIEYLSMEDDKRKVVDDAFSVKITVDGRHFRCRWTTFSGEKRQYL